MRVSEESRAPSTHAEGHAFAAHGNWRRIAANLLPGVLLPGLIYYAVSRSQPSLVALAAASAVPALDAVVRMVRRRPQSPYGVFFLAITGVSISLAVWLRSPMFILAKGAVLTGLMGVAFLVSAAIRRPLTRTLALLLSEECRHARRAKAKAWAHPKITAVFRVLAVGWAVLLLGSAAQQAALILTVPAGTVMAVEPPAQLAFTLVGIVLSVRYVRRVQRAHAEVRLIPA
jgi:intracellular septation protein A